MLSCFSSTAHEEDRYYNQNYSPSVLPQLSASTRNGRSPLLKRPSLRFDKKRPSYGSGSSDREKRALKKTMIGNPTGFQHVGGSGFAEMSEKSNVKPPVPPRPHSIQPASKPLPAVSPNSATPPPRPPRERPFSLPTPPRAALTDSSNQNDLVPPLPDNAARIVRRQSLSPPKRKPAPPVTPSLIQQVEGGNVRAAKSTPSRLRDLSESRAKTRLEIEDLFSKSELRVIEKYEEVADGKVETVASTIKGGGGNGETDWKGAMKEIERALQSTKPPST